MKHPLLALAAIWVLVWSYIPKPALADAPQPGILSITLIENTVSLGEPLVLKYQIINVENKPINIYMGKRDQGWLRMSLNDASDHPAQELPNSTSRRASIYTEGATLDATSNHVGYVVVSQKFQPPHIGQYRLNLSTHLTYSWKDGTSERYTEDQSFVLPVTVTARDPQRLHTVAEGLSQTVLHARDISQYQKAAEALFSMRDPDCLPVWRELATDPSLDPWRAMDVVRQLENVGSIAAVDVLAEMEPIAPERWARTGNSPVSTLQSMWSAASPEVKQHINERLQAAGIPAVTKHTRLTGEVN